MPTKPTPTLESLEPRRHLAVDLALSLASTTLPSSLVAGVSSRPAVARITLTNSNTDNTPTNRDLAPIPLLVTLTSSTGTIRTLTQSNLSARNLRATASRTFSIRIPLPSDLTPGTYTVSATAGSPEILADPNPNNNTATLRSVVVASPFSDLAVSASARVAPTVNTGAPVSVRTTLSNLGNFPANATADLEITSTINNRTEVLTVVKNVKLKALPGKSASLKPVTVRLIGDPAGNAPLTLSARLTKIANLTGDNPDNNSATAATTTVRPPPPSVFISSRPNAPVIVGNTITFKRTSFNTTDPNFIFEELGTWVDSNGRTGTYDHRQSKSGKVLHPLFLISNSGTPFLFGDFAAPYTLGNKTVTFTTTQAGSAGSISTLSTTLFFRYGK